MGHQCRRYELCSAGFTTQKKIYRQLVFSSFLWHVIQQRFSFPSHEYITAISWIVIDAIDAVFSIDAVYHISLSVKYHQVPSIAQLTIADSSDSYRRQHRQLPQRRQKTSSLQKILEIGKSPSEKRKSKTRCKSSPLKSAPFKKSKLSQENGKKLLFERELNFENTPRRKEK